MHILDLNCFNCILKKIWSEQYSENAHWNKINKKTEIYKKYVYNILKISIDG